MTDDIIRMAREAGSYPTVATDGALLLFSESHLERFAALVAAEWQEKCNIYMELHDAVVKDNDRLYALNAELVEALKLCLSHLERDDQHINALGKHRDYYAKSLAAIAKAQGDNND